DTLLLREHLLQAARDVEAREGGLERLRAEVEAGLGHTRDHTGCDSGERDRVDGVERRGHPPAREAAEAAAALEDARVAGAGEAVVHDRLARREHLRGLEREHEQRREEHRGLVDLVRLGDAALAEGLLSSFGCCFLCLFGIGHQCENAVSVWERAPVRSSRTAVLTTGSETVITAKASSTFSGMPTTKTFICGTVRARSPKAASATRIASSTGATSSKPTIGTCSRPCSASPASVPVLGIDPSGTRS